MSQSEQFGEAWAYVRDHARPVIQDDVYFLDGARADMPPSKAHVRRLKRLRPEVVPDQPRGTASHERRLHINQAAAYGRGIADLLGVRDCIKR